MPRKRAASCNAGSTQDRRARVWNDDLPKLRKERETTIPRAAKDAIRGSSVGEWIVQLHGHFMSGSAGLRGVATIFVI